MSAKTLPDQITDLLIALVFIGKLVPGDKLPPERQLAAYLGVDRTSLRMALRTLTRMNVMHTLQGSGVRVLDYKKNGGLDFLSNLYQIEELELGNKFLLSGVDVFSRIMPAAVSMSVEKNETGTKNSQVKVLDVIHSMYQGLHNGDSYRQLASLEVEMIDILLESTGNVFMQLAGSGSRRIRLALTEKNYELIDVKAHLDWVVSTMMKITSGVSNMDDVILQYTEYMAKKIQPLKEYLSTLPAEPRLVSSPLHNGKNIMDLDEIMSRGFLPVSD